ncbi:hypothetical protein H6P81_020083 [Aristolochia fimbriata]|uniref:Transposase-associated domain-containing protein n=1 Tax=Aristolochia fimbriata TaxID=158543 RepID=A0AAV7DUG2_ARIFI|nr:hypothetical protein H6P81_020083 [Aristolochia fimbriata]
MDYFNDKSWMYKFTNKHERCSAEFVGGVRFFMEFAKQHKGVQGDGVMLYPCARCENKLYLECGVIEYHIVREGFVEGYSTWYIHGESPVADAFLVANKVSSQDPKDLGPILDEVYNGHHGGYERGLGEGWSRAKNTTAVASSQKASQLQEANGKIDGLTEMVRVLHGQVRELREQGNGSSKSGEPSSSGHSNASGCGPSS